MDGLLDQLVDNGLDSIGRYYSIYRGVVVDIDDIYSMDRLKVYVPNLDIIEWALPRNQMGSHNCGFRSHALPKIQDIVYVTFEDGNPSKPLWEWHGWGEDQRPEDFDDSDVCGIVTPKGTKVLINDRTGEVVISAKSRIAVQAEGEDGIVIAANKIFLNSKDQIVINQGTNGVIDIVELTQKLNKLVEEVNSFRSIFNSHTHPGVTSGNGSTSPTLTMVTTPVSTFNKTDYEDTALLH